MNYFNKIIDLKYEYQSRTINSKKFYIRFLACYLFSLGIYLILLNNTLIFPFMIHDEYRFFQTLAGLDWPHCCAGEVVADHYRFNGRFIAAEIMRLFSYLPIYTIDDLKFLRFFIILFMALSSTLLTAILIKLGLNLYFSLFSSIALFTLPGFTVSVSWLMSAPSIIAILPALLAFLISISKISSFRKFVFISILLFVSLHTYQSSTPVFFLPLIFLILFKDINEKKFIKFFQSLSILYIFTYLFYFILHKTILFLTTSLSWASPNKLQFGFTNDIFQKLSFFINTVTYKSLNLWFIKLEYIYYLFLIIILLSILILFLRSKKIKLKFVLSLLIIIGFANIQNILPKVDFIQYRTITIYQCIILTLVIWSFTNISNFFLKNNLKCRIFSSLLFLIIGTVVQMTNVNKNVYLSNLEYRHIKSKVLSHLRENNTLTQIYVISAITRENFNINNDFDNHKNLLSYANALNYIGEKIWISGELMQYPENNYASFREEWPAYILSILREIKGNKLPITSVCDANHQPENCENTLVKVAYNGYVGKHSNLADDIYKDKKTLHIDMRNLKEIKDTKFFNLKLKRQDNIRNSNDKKNKNLLSMKFPVLIFENYDNLKINIILYKGTYYSFPQNLNEFSIKKFNSHIGNKGVFKSKDIDKLLKTLIN